jgi:solute carrier family 36 (proton-coupled amino acid transporter)
LFAVPEAAKNGGLILAPVFTLCLGVICVHSQHVLLQCSAKMREKHQLTTKPDYAETFELCFLTSKNPGMQALAPAMKQACDIFICITQLGFCCVYLLFVSTSIEQIAKYYGFDISLHLLMVIVLIPIWLSALITNLKYLGECLACRSNFQIIK